MQIALPDAFCIVAEDDPVVCASSSSQEPESRLLSVDCDTPSNFAAAV